MLKKKYDISSGFLSIARYHHVLIISTFTSRILSFIHVAMNDEAKTHGDLTLCCVLTFWNSSNE
jgi:hypothetical protein